MNKKFFNSLVVVAFLSTILTSCSKDLDRFPTNDVTSEIVYSTAAGYKQAFAKVYGAYALTGNQGPSGNKDIQGSLDEGNFTDFLRTFFYAQELTTDEAMLTWADPGLPDFHNMSWSTTNGPLTGLYYRSTFQITLANDFLNQSTTDKLSSRGITGNDAENILRYRDEVRFLRAFQYWVLMDLYGNPPFITEADKIGAALPRQIKRAELFNYIESELKEIQASLPAPKTNEYGRADQAAAWALLARLYLNAQIYTGTARYTDAVTYSKKVIDAGYSLIPDYRQLALADNQLNKNEFILTINYDGARTQSYGGTTFLTHAPVGGSMQAAKFGIGGGWAGLRTTKNLPNLFPDNTGTLDQRSQFYTAGQTLEITDVSQFSNGYGVTKYRNVKRDGTGGSSADYSDVDFPLFRLSEMYLVYTEAVLRGGTGGDAATALGYINLLRQRAYAGITGNIPATQLTVDFVLDERGRELYWEGYRRTDLIRYGKFTTSAYLWPWKGGVANGKAVSDFRNLFPIPSADVTANTNLTQNPGY